MPLSPVDDSSLARTWTDRYGLSAQSIEGQGISNPMQERVFDTPQLVERGPDAKTYPPATVTFGLNPPTPLL